MIVYDFDDTIYQGDSGVDFFKYCFSKRPILVLLSLLKTIIFLPLYALKIIRTKELKEKIFSFIKRCNNIDELVEDFWDLNEYKIKSWYLKQQSKDDVVISASYDFLIEPICKRINIKHVITTEYNLKTGKTIGLHCQGKNKIVKFEEKFPDKKMKQAYSDAGVDRPILEYAKEGFIVIDNQIIPYTKDYQFKNKTIKYLRDYDFLNILVSSLLGVIILVMFTYIFNLFFEFIISFSFSYLLSIMVICLFSNKYLYKTKYFKNILSMFIYSLMHFVLLLLIYRVSIKSINNIMLILSILYFIFTYMSLYLINKGRGIE